MYESNKGGGFSSKADGEISYAAAAASGLHVLCPICVTLGSQRRRLSLCLALNGGRKQTQALALCYMGSRPGHSEQMGLVKVGSARWITEDALWRGIASRTMMNV